MTVKLNIIGRQMNGLETLTEGEDNPKKLLRLFGTDCLVESCNPVEIVAKSKGIRYVSIL